MSDGIEGVWAIIIVSAAMVPLAIWKVVDIVLWLFNNIHISVGV